MNSKSTIVSLLWSFLEQGGSKIVAIVVQVVMARLLAPEIFGITAILLVIVEIANTLAQSGLGLALIQNKQASMLSFTTSFWLSLLFSLLLYLVLFLAAPLIAAFYQMVELELYIRVLSIVLIFNSFNSIQRSYLQKEMNFKALFISNFIAVVVSGVFGVVLAISGFGIWALMGQVILQAMLVCVVMCVQVPWKPTFNFSLIEAKKLLSFGVNIALTGLLGTLYTGISELILGKTCTVSDLGFYSNGQKWPKAVFGAATNALQNVFFPAFSRLSGNVMALRAAMKKTLLAGSFLVVMFSAISFVIAEPLTSLVLSDKWLPCVPIFQLYCVSNCLLILQLVNLRAYMALGKSQLLLILQLLKVLSGIMIIGAFALFSRDIYCVALVTAIHTVVCILCIDLFPAKRIHGFGAMDQIRILVPILAIAVAAAIISSLLTVLSLPNYVLLLAQIMVYLFVYVSLAKIFRLSSLNEFMDVIRSLRRSKG